MDTIDLHKFDISTQILIRQVLNYAQLKSSKEEISQLYADNMPAIVHCNETAVYDKTQLGKVVHYWHIMPSTADSVIAAVLMVRDELLTIDRNSEVAKYQYTVDTGIQIDATTITRLTALARSIRPAASIKTTVRIDTSSDFASCVESIAEAAAAQECTSLDYGQYNIGIVVTGTMFELSSTHPIVAEIVRAMEEFSK